MFSLLQTFIWTLTLLFVQKVILALTLSVHRAMFFTLTLLLPTFLCKMTHLQKKLMWIDVFGSAGSTHLLQKVMLLTHLEHRVAQEFFVPYFCSKRDRV